MKARLTLATMLAITALNAVPAHAMPANLQAMDDFTVCYTKALQERPTAYAMQPCEQLFDLAVKLNGKETMSSVSRAIDVAVSQMLPVTPLVMPSQPAAPTVTQPVQHAKMDPDVLIRHPDGTVYTKMDLARDRAHFKSELVSCLRAQDNQNACKRQYETYRSMEELPGDADAVVQVTLDMKALEK